MSDSRWCSDALEIRPDNGERVRMAFSLDCCDREVMSWVAVANGGIDGDLVRDMMLEAIEYRFSMLEAPTPIQWLSDNGSPDIAGDTRRFARELNLVPLTTPIESPPVERYGRGVREHAQARLRVGEPDAGRARDPDELAALDRALQ